jgi:beta-glucanase (GH16 family)
MTQILRHKKKIITVSIIGIILLGTIGSIIALKSANVRTADTDATLAKSKELLFSDEFDGPKLDTTKWQTCYDNYSAQFDGCTNYGNWESEWYKSSQVNILQGNLVLTADKQLIAADNKFGTTQDYEYVSGMVSTGSVNKVDPAKWQNTYGYYEARMLVPDGQAIWPAFWLLPTDHDWPPEIDIMETVGQKPNELINTYFWKGGKNEPVKDSSVYTHSENLSDNWHTYAVDWQPGSIKWYLDDKLVKTAVSGQVSSKPMHIILNLAVGGMLPGEPDDTTPKKSIMLVDYVRVYKN